MKVLLGASHKHLDNFYVIVPALCIAFVEDAIIGKDLMYKPNRRGEAYYTDDGFAMGIAYVLAILDQGAKFDSLHWFEAVDRKLADDERSLAERKKAQSERTKKETRSSIFSAFGAKKQQDSSTYEDDEVGTESFHCPKREKP
jgi:WASH complex subunit 7